MSANTFATQVNNFIRAKAELFALLTSHTTITGAGRENALREFIHDLIPKRYEALTGTVAPAPGSDNGNSQVDLMVVNTLDFPVLVRDGVLAAVLPQSVVAIVEIKTDLDDPDKLNEALRQIQRTHRLFPLDKPPLSILFSYGRPATMGTLARNLKSALGQRDQHGQGWRSSDLPDCIIASGVENACIATLAADGPSEASANCFQVQPHNTISYLLYRILGQLTPKPPGARATDRVTVETEAWMWIDGYFNIELTSPMVDQIELVDSVDAKQAEENN